MACRRLLFRRSYSPSFKLFPDPPCVPSGVPTRSFSTNSNFTSSDLGSRWELGFRLGSERSSRRRDGWERTAIGVTGVGTTVALRRSSAMEQGVGAAAAAGSDSSRVDDDKRESDEPVAKPRRFAVLTTGYAADYCTETYGGYGPMFIKLLSDPGEEWDEYLVLEGQFPSPEDLPKYDGFVVTGSRHDAHGEEAWIVKLCELLQQLHEMKKKALCVCFGHQVLSRALGGKTGRASVGWEVGLRDICLTDAFFSKSYAAGMPPSLKVLQVHRDQVSKIPTGAELLASSERTGVEMFAIGDHALAIQGHPEFFDDVVDDLLNGRLAPLMTKEEIEFSKETLREGRADQQAWQQLCKDFLKGRKARD